MLPNKNVASSQLKDPMYTLRRAVTCKPNIAHTYLTYFTRVYIKASSKQALIYETIRPLFLVRSLFNMHQAKF